MIHYIWWVFVSGTIVFFLYSVFYTGRKSLKEDMIENMRLSHFKQDILLGLAFMGFDFIIETVGGFLGLWTSKDSLLFIGYVPIEVMIICFFGGIGWSIQLFSLSREEKYVGKKFIYFLLFWTTGGALGEQILIEYGVMEYGCFMYIEGLGCFIWTIYWAWLAYLLTWLLMTFTFWKIHSWIVFKNL
jgi:hypothetical protein